MNLPKVTLWCHEGKHDKIYELSIVADGDGYGVQYAYGRRGAALTTDFKNPVPVTLAEAEKIFAALMKEKLRKGYQVTAGADIGADVQPVPKIPSVPKVPSADAEQSSAFGLPQLCNSIDEATALKLLSDPNWIMQEKFDGERLTVSVSIANDPSGNRVTAAFEGGNKRGKWRPVPHELCMNLKDFPDCKLDGELVGDIYKVFDVLSIDGADLFALGAGQRIMNITSAALPMNRCVHQGLTAFSTTAKRLLFNKIKRDGGEGVVFKLRDEPYKRDRPSRGGDWLKFKFVHDATCRVAAVNQKRSIALEMLDRENYGGWRSVGNVSVPANQPIPAVGDIVEVRYLYAYRGGALAQPVLKGIRHDCTEKDCYINQLFYKPEPSPSAA